MSAELHVRDLRKTFVRHDRGGQRLDVLCGVDLDLNPGTFTVIEGPSGSGKSSLLRCIYGSYLPSDGSILLTAAGVTVDLAAIPERQLLDARVRLVGMANQFLQVVPRVAAVDLVAAEGLSRQEAAELLLSLGLDHDLLELPPAGFSGGERQMVNLAMTLARPRPLLLLDEVTASMDTTRRGLALRALRQCKLAGATLLAIFHDVPAQGGLVDRVVKMREGRLAA